MPRRKNRAIMPFQSTLPRRERHTILLSIFPDVYFNPRSREGSDLTGSTLADTTRKISIHAPAKGATVDQDKADYACHISIHAPAKGATSPVASSSTSSIYFNPRSREGSDICQPYLAMFLLTFQSTLPRRERRTDCVIPSATSSISIHAPAKGATTATNNLPPAKRISIHAPAKGATAKSLIHIIPTVFQSTLPRRERRWRQQRNTKAYGFQSTLPRRERRRRDGFLKKAEEISIHAPAKGAT